MTVVSLMSITVKPGTRAAAIDAFFKRRVLEECREAIEGFISAQVLEDLTSPDRLSVLAEWENAAAFHEWVEHPLRMAQEADLSGFLADLPTTTISTRKKRVSKPGYPIDDR